MFTPLVKTLTSELEDLRSNLVWQDKLRRSVHPVMGDVAPVALSPVTMAAMQLQAPDRLSWQLFDHCAAVTRSYALFEKFVDDLVRAYVALLPTVWPDYMTLLEVLRVQYRLGVGTLLGKWGEGSVYAHLPEPLLATGLVDGLNSRPYSLVAEAFLTDSNNYRAETLNKLFSRVGVEKIFDWVKAAIEIENFCVVELSGSETAESFLGRLILIRNEAAHSQVTHVSSVGELLKFVTFLGLLAESLAARLRDELIINGLQAHCSKKLGSVVHCWTGNVVGIETAVAGSFAVGQEVYVGKDRLQLAVVQELRYHNVPEQSLQLVPGQRFSALLSVRVANSASIYQRLTI